MYEKKEKHIFLATTALEDFWDITKKIVFLGDWCRRYSSDRNMWESLNGEVLEDVWKDKQRFIDAYGYLKDVYERTLQQMAELLDEVHGEKHSVRYWRIIIGPWLFHYIDVLYDRYLCIQQAISKYQYFDTIILSEDSFITPRSTLEYILLILDDPYNLQIYSKILLAQGYNVKQKPYVIKRKANPISKNIKIKNFFKKIFSYCSLLLAKKRGSIYLVEPYFSKSSIIKFFLKTKGKVTPLLFANEHIPEVRPNSCMRNFFQKLSLNNNKFENLLVKLIPYDIPYTFLEQYKMLRKESLKYPSKPKVIVSWVSWYFNEPFKIWAGTLAESGCLLYGAQHGGNYGIDQYMQAFEHEVAITDKYFTWGWNDGEFNERLVPMTISINTGKKRIKKNKRNSKILFAGTATPRYLYRMQFPTCNQMEKYCNDQMTFLKCLSSSYRKFISYRGFIKDYGLDIEKRIHDVFPDLIMEGWDIPFQKSLAECRLFVCDHLSTIHAEALSQNIPTILFWDPDSCIHKREALLYLEKLKKVGILHYSPESAANMVCDVYDNVDDWWNDHERQSARIDFCDRYARNTNNAVNEWVSEFRKISR